MAPWCPSGARVVDSSNANPCQATSLAFPRNCTNLLHLDKSTPQLSAIKPSCHAANDRRKPLTGDGDPRWSWAGSVFRIRPAEWGCGHVSFRQQTIEAAVADELRSPWAGEPSQAACMDCECSSFRVGSILSIFNHSKTMIYGRNLTKPPRSSAAPDTWAAPSSAPVSTKATSLSP